MPTLHICPELSHFAKGKDIYAAPLMSWSKNDLVHVT
jgi:hypothetical protein